MVLKYVILNHRGGNIENIYWTLSNCWDLGVAQAIKFKEVLFMEIETQQLLMRDVKPEDGITFVKMEV